MHRFRRSFPPLALVSLLACSSAALLHCGGATNNAQAVPDGGVAEAGPPLEAGGEGEGEGGTPNPDAVGATTSGKLDLLLVVDNSASMGDKANALSASIGTLLRRVSTGRDVHVGVISSSLGAMGGDTCAETGAQNGLAHLSTTGPGDVAVASAAQGFLSFGAGGAQDIEAFVADAASLVKGVGERGCGFEAQLESAYRFLVQPDPWASVKLNAMNQAEAVGVDSTVLKQRAAFLRPDSLVLVVMLTDEDDSSVDPLAVGGQGWAFSNNQFPGSTTFRADGKTTTGPRATSACAANPGSADCTSCGFAATCNSADPACQKIKSDPECQKNAGYYGPAEDQLNVRFHRMKQRYGIDPQFPLSRYVDGFTKERVPNREGEHKVDGTAISPYLGVASCTNPLFASALPTTSGEELCNLPKGPRGKELVLFTVIGGVPESLTGASPDWTKILGSDPDAYRDQGQDPHMLQSTSPRAGLPAPSATPGDNGSDPVHGREWNTNNDDLQYACTFTLPAPRTCSAADPSCDCAGATNPPLCGQVAGQQLKAKAYPTLRELRVVKGLGDRGIAGSICAADAALGYAATMNRVGDAITPRLTP